VDDFVIHTAFFPWTDEEDTIIQIPNLKANSMSKISWKKIMSALPGRDESAVKL
jgi:hypothetical protein